SFFFCPAAAGGHWGASLEPDDPHYRQATTGCLTAIVLTQIVNVHLCRTRRAPLRSRRFFSNRLITAGIVVELAAILFIDYSKTGNTLFGTAPLSWRTWTAILPFALGMLLVEECRKTIVRRRTAGPEFRQPAADP